MVKFIQDFGVGGGRPMDLWHFFEVGSSGNPPIWIRDLGDDPQCGEDPRRIPPQCGRLS